MPIKLFMGSMHEPMGFAQLIKTAEQSNTKIVSEALPKVPNDRGLISNKKVAILSDFGAMPDCGFVRQPEVRKLFGCSKATVWRWVKSGKIPKPVHLGGRVAAWNVGELRQALSNALVGGDA